MARNYAALPHDYLEELADLSDAEFGRLIRALLTYSMTGREEALNGGERYLWRRVRNQEDRFQESYDSVSNVKSDAGKKGAAKRWQKIADDSKEWQKIADDSRGWQNMAEDGRGWQAIADDGKNGYTETNTKTNTNTETYIQLASASMDNSAQAREDGCLPSWCDTEEKFISMIRTYQRRGWELSDTMVSFINVHPEINFGQEGA